MVFCFVFLDNFH